MKRWTLHVGDSFGDVPRSSGFYRFVETLLHHGVTAGCTATTYCPVGSTMREQMAVFLLTTFEPPGYVPPACTTPAFPDVPTFKEQGYDMEGTGWYGLFAPAGTPQAAIDRLSRAAIAAIKDAGVNQKMLAIGLQPTGHGPAELARIMKADYDKWGPVIRASGFKPGN